MGRIFGFEITPDGSFIMSSGQDKSLRIWSVRTGKECGAIFLPGRIESMTVHPLRPTAVCLDSLGCVHRIDFVGVEYEPLVVTAWRGEERSRLFRRAAANHVQAGCPACRRWWEAPVSVLGTEVTCSRCGQKLKLNSFTINADWRPVARAWSRLVKPESGG
jgi:hypothetical protein